MKRMFSARNAFSLWFLVEVACFAPDDSPAIDADAGTASESPTTVAGEATDTNTLPGTSTMGSTSDASATDNPMQGSTSIASMTGEGLEGVSTTDGAETGSASEGPVVDCVDDDTSCPDRAPRCFEGTCRSCTEVACSPEADLREAMALACRFALERPSNVTTLATPTTAFCAGAPGNAPIVREVLAGLRSGRATSAAIRLRQCADQYPAPFRYEYCLLRETPGRDLANFGGSVLSLPTVGPRGVCRTDVDCITAECIRDADPCSGTCRAAGIDNEACSSDASCSSADVCYHEENGNCFDRPPTSGPCLFNSYCDDGLYCSANTTCEPLGASDEPCSNVRGCELGLFCDAQVCHPLPANGEVCVNAFPFLSACGLGTRCVTSVNECRTTQADGAPCNANQPCEYGSACHEGICEPVRLRNDPCTESSVCAPGLVCTDGVCQSVIPALGDPCTDLCARGRCTNGTCVADVGADVACNLGALGMLDSCPYDQICSDICVRFDNEGGCDEIGSRCVTPGRPICETLE